MSKKTKNIILNSLVVMTYLLLIGLLVFSVLSLKDRYHEEEIKMITEAERLIKDALNETKNEDIKKELDKAREDYQFDIVVIEEDKVIYASIPYQFGDTLLTRVHEEATTRIAQGNHEVNGRVFNVWYTIYKLSDSVYLNSFLSSILIITLITSLLLVLSVFLIFRVLFDPMKTLKKSLDAAEDYDFKNVKSDEDIINRDFKQFTNRLERNINAVSRQHTELEKELQTNREHLKNTLLVSRSMIHDLKTPVHQNIIENDIAARKYEDIKELEELAIRNQELNHDIMMEINTILRMLKSDQEEEEVVELDLVELVSKSIARFGINLQEKDLIVDLDAPESAKLKVDESAMILLINNLLSNMTQYSMEHGELKVVIDQDNRITTLTFMNKASEDNIERMKKSEQLFNAVEDPTTGDNIYSSGNGLYLIKDLVSMLGGAYKLSTNKDDVIIEVKFTHET